MENTYPFDASGTGYLVYLAISAGGLMLEESLHVMVTVVVFFGISNPSHPARVSPGASVSEWYCGL